MVYGMGEKIRAERNRMRLTQTQLATRIGVERTMVSLYESGGSTPPSDVLAKLAAALQVSADYLLGLSKQQTMNVDGLENHQVDVLKALANELRDANRYKNRVE